MPLFAARALAQDVVIEPGAVFFANAQPPVHFMRVGYSSIALNRIEEGVRRLSGLL